MEREHLEQFPTLTKRDKKELRIENFLFQFNCSKNGKEYWVCKQSRTATKCPSRCVTDESGKLIKKPTKPHNHEPYDDNYFKFAGFIPVLKQKYVLLHKYSF